MSVLRRLWQLLRRDWPRPVSPDPLGSSQPNQSNVRSTRIHWVTPTPHPYVRIHAGIGIVPTHLVITDIKVASFREGLVAWFQMPVFVGTCPYMSCRHWLDDPIRPGRQTSPPPAPLSVADRSPT